LIDQKKIHSQCFSKDPKERIEALEQFRYKFLLLPDKYGEQIDRCTSLCSGSLSLTRSEIFDKKVANQSDIQQGTNDKIDHIRLYRLVPSSPQHESGE